MTGSLRLNWGDLLWHKMLLELLVQRAYYEFQSAYISTLGGAYASLGNAHQARAFAKKQMVVATRLGNLRMLFVARVYLVYYYLTARRFDTARRRLDRLRESHLFEKDEFHRRVWNACDMRLRLLTTDERK